MKTVLYLVRHGESEGNAVRSFLGHTNLDITQKGHAQAECTAEYLKNVHADVIYSSDLLRAYNTAKHTADKKGMEIIKNEKLREIDAGEWENRLFEDLEKEYADSYHTWRNDVGNACPNGGERVCDLQKRIVSELTKIAQENEGRSVFIFTHATPIRTFKAYCDGKTVDEIKDVPWASNASVSIAEYENGSFAMKEYSIDSFMDSLTTILPPNV